MSLPLPYDDDDLDITGTDPPDDDEAIDTALDSFDELPPAEDPEAEGEIEDAIDPPGPVDD